MKRRLAALAAVLSVVAAGLIYEMGASAQDSDQQGSVDVVVSAGREHSCGVKSDGSVACWGSSRFKQASAPAGVFSSVSAGDLHSCGVKSDGSVACWGHNGFKQVSAPAGVFSSVSAGEHHSCGVKSDESVVCWGSNTNGRSTVPTGAYASVSAGDDHSCGVKTDNTVSCWGHNGSGRSTVPMELNPVPTVPTNLQVSCVNGVLDARWDRVHGANDYRLHFYKLNATKKWERESSLDYDGNANEHVLSPASGSYKVHVQAYNTFGQSNFTDYSEVACVLDLNPHCSAAFGLDINKVRCFWEQVIGATQYNIQIRSTGASTTETYQSPGSNAINLAQSGESVASTLVYTDFSGTSKVSFQAGDYEVRVQVHKPTSGSWSSWSAFTFELLPPYCTQSSFAANDDEEKGYPVRCWLPYFSNGDRLDLDISYEGVSVKVFEISNGSKDNAVIGVSTKDSDSMLLPPKGNEYTIRWRPNGQTAWSHVASLQVQEDDVNNECSSIGRIMSPVARTTYTASNSGPRDENHGSNGWGDRPAPLGFHPALDIGKDQTGASDVGGWAVYAVHDGVVTVNQGKYAGTYVTLEHRVENSANCWVTQYMHLMDPSDPGTPARCGLPTAIGGVSVPVTQGTRIGCIGNTGRSFGSHLHFVLKYRGQHQDPFPYIKDADPFSCPSNVPVEVKGFCYKDQPSVTLQLASDSCPSKEQHRHGSQGCHHKLLDHNTGCLIGWHKHDDLACHKTGTSHEPPPCSGEQHRHDSHDCHHKLLDHNTGCLIGWHKHGSYSCHKSSTSHSSK